MKWVKNREHLRAANFTVNFPKVPVGVGIVNGYISQVLLGVESEQRHQGHHHHTHDSQ